MSLSRSQQEFIDNSLSHLLDFPNTQRELSASVSELLRAIEEPYNADSEHYDLVNCLLYPESRLQRLEHFDNTQTLYLLAVQEYILNLITTNITTACEQANVTLAELGFDPKKILNEHIPAWHNQKAFISQPPTQTHIAMPWEEITLGKDCIYTASIKRSGEQEAFATLTLKIVLPDEEYLFTIRKFKSLPLECDEFDEMYNLIKDADHISQFHALQQLKTSLIYNNITTGEIIAIAFTDPNTKYLLLDKFYLSQLYSQKIVLSSLAGLSAQQVKRLLSDQAKQLLSRELCSFEQICNSDDMNISLISTYNQAITAGELSVAQLLALDKEQAKTLSIPIITNLFAQKKISFDDAKQLPSAIHPILMSSLYMDYITAHPINWQMLSLAGPHHTELLLAPEIAILVKDNILTFSHIFLLTNEQVSLIKLPSCHDLIKSGILTTHNIFELNHFSIMTLLSNPLIRDGLAAGIIQYTDITHPDSSEENQALSRQLYSSDLIYEFIFKNRLSSVYERYPIKINSIPDNLEVIISDLEHIKATNYIDTKPILNKLLCDLKSKIQNKLFEFSMSFSNSTNKEHIKQILPYTMHNTKHKMYNHDTLAEMLTCMKDILASISKQESSPRLFRTPVARPSLAFVKFIEHIVSFEPLLTYYNETYPADEAQVELTEIVIQKDEITNHQP